MAQFTITEATGAADIEAVRALCWAYRDFLLGHSEVDQDITETFYPKAKYTALMTKLETVHARPTGIILLAKDKNGAAVGCGMTHPLDGTTSEIKRVFVNDTARGQGVAAQLCTALVAQAKADGFERIVLDTSKGLHAAQRLYDRLGFIPCGPYQPIPPEVLPELLFYEKTLP